MLSRWKKSSLDFQQYNHFKYQKICLCARFLVLEWTERAFIEQVNSRCFCWFPAAILVHQNGTPIWRLHTKIYKGAWNVSANNSETVSHKDLTLGLVVYILVFYNISFSWLLPLEGFQFIFFVLWQWKRPILSEYRTSTKHHISIFSASTPFCYYLFRFCCYCSVFVFFSFVLFLSLYTETAPPTLVQKFL